MISLNVVDLLLVFFRVLPNQRVVIEPIAHFAWYLVKETAVAVDYPCWTIESRIHTCIAVLDTRLVVNAVSC